MNGDGATPMDVQSTTDENSQQPNSENNAADSAPKRKRRNMFDVKPEGIAAFLNVLIGIFAVNLRSSAPSIPPIKEFIEDVVY